MARSKAYLVAEGKKCGVEFQGQSIEEMMDVLRDVKLMGRSLVEQLDPMAAKDCKVYFNYDLPKPWSTPEMKVLFWENKNIIAEPKLDGVRMKAHLTPTGYRFDSRGRSDVTYEYNELTANFPQFGQEAFPENLVGTVIDGEFMMPLDSIDTGAVVTQGTLTTTMAVTGSGPDKAIPLQEKYGWCRYHAFDIIRLAGRDTTDMPWCVRRNLLERLVRKLNNPYIEITPVIVDKPDAAQHLSRIGISGWQVVPSLMEYFESLVDGGGEGLMFKNINAKYELGRRRDAWMKLKKFSSYDGFITGYLPGENSFTGLVGSLCVSAYLPNGELFEFASVSQMTYDLRQTLTAPDGSLRPEYLGKVVEVMGQERTKTGRLRHAILFRWRPDRTPESCHYSDQ